MAVRNTKYGIECDQNWEDLQTRDCGKFCESCNKSVMDFTQWDRDTMLRYMQQHPKACGRFRMDHLQPDLKPIIPFHFNLRTILFGALSAWGLSEGGAIPVKEKATIIQLVPEPRLSPAAIQPENTISHEIKYDPAPLTDSTRAKQPKAKRVYKRYYISGRTYFSWKFPFIHKRRHFTGCPDF